MKTILPFFLFFSFSVSAQTTRFFISAHQDDWQLFMNPNVYRSIKNNNDKTVIIHTTAGDAEKAWGNDPIIKHAKKAVFGHSDF